MVKNHPLADKENISFLDFKNDVFISAFPKEVTKPFMGKNIFLLWYCCMENQLHK